MSSCTNQEVPVSEMKEDDIRNASRATLRKKVQSKDMTAKRANDILKRQYEISQMDKASETPHCTEDTSMAVRSFEEHLHCRLDEKQRQVEYYKQLYDQEKSYNAALQDNLRKCIDCICNQNEQYKQLMGMDRTYYYTKDMAGNESWAY